MERHAPRFDARSEGSSLKLAGTLGALGTQPAERRRPELERLIRDNTAPGASDEQNRKIRDRALSHVGELADDKLAEFIDAWKAELERGELSVGSEEGAVAMRDVLNLRDVKIRQTSSVCST